MFNLSTQHIPMTLSRTALGTGMRTCSSNCEEVKKEPKGGLAPPLIRGGEWSPISPLPEGGDKLNYR